MTEKKKLNTGYLDVFIDGIKIPRSDSNRTIKFTENSTFINPTIWDPDETINITVSLKLSKGTHISHVSTEYGIKDSRIFEAK